MDSVGQNSRVAFTALDLRQRAAGTLIVPDRVSSAVMSDAAGRGDYDLTPDLCGETDGLERPTAAAVLVPIVDRAPEATVLLTLRTDDLPTHAGQIAFPGGKMEAVDGTPLDTALRETREEIGLAPEFVDVVGFLDTYQTGTGYRIAPAVAVVSSGFTLALDGTEVAEAFEVPLSFLMDAANHQQHSRTLRGRHRTYYAMPYQDRYIWGATAGILRNLYDWLYR
ncbi:MAG: CoA pyrophosphatase [Methyloligellaceae bacterium]